MADDVWTVKRILEWIEGYLRGKGDANPRLSAQWLVSEALGVSRMELYLDPDRPLTGEERGVLRDYTRRRGTGEPLQYITGTTDFRFITVKVRPGVLIPRPETEVLVSEALSQLEAARAVKHERWAETERAFAADADGQADGGSGEHPAPDGMEAPDSVEAAADPDDPPCLLVADLCTGSGCIACAIASEIPHARVVATDIDPAAVSLARENACNLGLEDRVSVVECDLGEGVDAGLLGKFNLVISNPPYVPTGVLAGLDAEVTSFEPALALDGGADGLDVFRRILPFSTRALAPRGVLAVELHETCLDEAARLARQAGFEKVRVADDLAGRKRVLVAQKG